MIYRHNNTLEHKSVVTKAVLRAAKFEVLEPSSYLPDSDPSDFHFVPYIKRALCRHHFAINGKVIGAVKDRVFYRA